MPAPSTRPTWIFDDSEIPDPFGHGQRAVDFLRSLKHPKSRLPGQAFQLDPWQERIVRKIYGPCHADGRRIVRTVTAVLPRGNRKTALGAGLTCLHLFGPERIPGGQLIAAAADQKQARLAYNEAAAIVAADPRIERVVRVADYRNKIEHLKTGSVLEAISADAPTQHGRTNSFSLVDELHSFKKRDLWDVIRTGAVKVPGSLIVVITTSGRGQENVAWDVVEYARKVARGDIDDPATLPILFEAPQDADWRDESLWYEVNPGLAHGYPDIEGLRQLALEAESRPADREAFKQLHCGIWLDHSADPFVEMSVYDLGARPVDLEALKKKPCWLAVDLSSNSDLTVILSAWKDGEDGYIVHPWFYCPKDNIRRRSEMDGVPYVQWAEEGLITPTPGNVVDYRFVEDQIRSLCDEYDVREIAFDPHLARNIMNNLGEDGLPVVEMRQGWVTMAPAIKELERAIVGGKFTHGGHPILRWCFSNIAVEVDKAGNKSFHKGKSTDRIDGAVVAAMAVARAAAGDARTSIFNDPTFDPTSLIVKIW